MGNIKFYVKWDFLTFFGDEERDSYFLGFFYADGSNDDVNGCITLKLKSEDKDFLQKLSDSIYIVPRKLYEGINPPHDVVLKETSFACLYIGCKGISSKLTQLGAPPRKTYTLQYPTFLTERQERHFIRGYFDGDGCVSETLAKDRNIQNRSIVICGNIEFLTGMKDALLKYTGLVFNIYPAVGIHQLCIGGNRQTLAFLKWLYEGCNWFLPRKFERYKTLLRDLQLLDGERDFISFCPKKNRWRGRLSSKYGRKVTGVYKTYEEALKSRKDAMQFLETHTLEEWLARPRKKWKKFDEQTLVLAKEYLKQGVSVKDAAIKVGMHFATLRMRLKEDEEMSKHNQVSD